VDASVFEGIQKTVAADRYALFTEFFKNFYNTDVLLGKRVSEQAVQASWNIAACASATASLARVPTWHEDSRKDLACIDVPSIGDSRRGGSDCAHSSRGSPDSQARQGRQARSYQGRAARGQLDPC
jgi:hypothetical protein